MRFLIVGAGGLGAVVAGYVSRAGHDVTIYVKAAQAAAFPRPEIHVTGIADFVAPVHLATSPEGLGHFDGLFVCVKGRDTEAALRPLRDVDVDCVLSLQNGVKKDDLLIDAFGRERVLGALALVSGELKSPGTVLNTAAAFLYLGELEGGFSERADRIATAIESAGIPASSVPDIRKREWDKLVLYLALALPSASTRVDTVTMVFNEHLLGVCVRIAVETATVAASEGFPLDVTDPGYREVLERFAGPIRDKGVVHYMSMTQDLMAGRPTELEFTAGDVLDRASRHAVPVQAISVCADLVRGLESVALASAHPSTLKR
jgi:2-dehydropantoate 2-reductase